MTKGRAAEIMRERKEAAQGTPVDPQRKNNARWFNAIVEHANVVLQDAGIATGQVSPELLESLRDSIEPRLLPTLLKAGEALIRLHDFCQEIVGTNSALYLRSPDERQADHEEPGDDDELQPRELLAAE